MSNVFVVEIWDIKQTISDAQREGYSTKKCNGTGHFQVVCKTKKKQNSGRGAEGPRRKGFRRKGGAPHHVM